MCGKYYLAEDSTGSLKKRLLDNSVYDLYIIEWDDELLTGDKNVDDHHKEMVETLNDYCHSVQYEMNNGTVTDIINKISFDIMKHFEEEEEFMLEIDYPEYQKHKDSHEGFLREFYYLKGKQEKNIPDAKYKLIKFCLSHIKNHITTMDKKLANYSTPR